MGDQHRTPALAGHATGATPRPRPVCGQGPSRDVVGRPGEGGGEECLGRQPLYCRPAPRLLLLWGHLSAPHELAWTAGPGWQEGPEQVLFPPGLGLARPGPLPSSAKLPVGHRPLGQAGGPDTPGARNCLRWQRRWGHGPLRGFSSTCAPSSQARCTGDQAQGWGSSAEGASKGRVRAGGLGVRLGQATEKGTGKASSSQGAMLPPSAGRWAEGPSGQCLTSSLRLPDPQALPRPCHGVF